MKVINMKILYIDMDGVLVNFQTGIDKLTEEQKQALLKALSGGSFEPEV